MDTHQGKTYVAMIVGGGDEHPDPQKAGRVKVFCPSLHGKDFDRDAAPWCQQSTVNGGHNSFPRPPQHGQLVQVQYLNDSGHFIVTGHLSGIHDNG